MNNNTKIETFGTLQTKTALQNNTIDKTKVLEPDTYNELFKEYVSYMSNLLNNKKD